MKLFIDVCYLIINYLVTPLQNNFFVDFLPENGMVFNKIRFIDTSSLSLAFQSYASNFRSIVTV